MPRAGSHKGRIRARRCAVQALYQWIITSTPPATIVKEFVADRELIDVDMNYFSELTREIPSKYVDLLAPIESAIDRSWAQIDTVERAVLLIGTYELHFCPQIPWRVVLNEAVELCKMFGAQDAHRYVNGVLDKIARAARKVEIEGQTTVKH